MSVIRDCWPPSTDMCDHPLVTDRVVYRSWMSDNLRWDALELRERDIVISAPPKCGSTWTQRLVSLLVFGGPDLPAPMAMVSPWLDLRAKPIGEVAAALSAQQHRRFIKTHTPLDGLVLDDRVTYIGVGRDPRDAAMSMVMDRDRIRALHGVVVPPHKRSAPPREPVRPPSRDLDLDLDRSPLEVLREWMERPITPAEGVMSLATILHHFGSVWHRRHLPNVALFHYADYRVNPVGELVRLGQVLGYDLGRDRAEELIEHATLDAMRARASELAPDIWRPNEPFFRAGGRREWRGIFTEADHQRYTARSGQLAPQDLLAWAHDGRRGDDPGAAR